MLVGKGWHGVKTLILFMSLFFVRVLSIYDAIQMFPVPWYPIGIG